MALVIDGDQFGPATWPAMMSALAQRVPAGCDFTKCVLAEPAMADMKPWRKALEEFDVRFVPVPRKAGGGKDPNDIAVASEATRLASTAGIDTIALAVADIDFLFLVRQLLSWELRTLVLLQKNQLHISLFEEAGAEVIPIKAGSQAQTPLMKAVLDPSGEGRIERNDVREGQDPILDHRIEQKLRDLDYLAEVVDPRCIPAIAKFYVANGLGPLSVWPPQLALAQFLAEVVEAGDQMAFVRDPGDLVYVFPCNASKGNKGDVLKYGTLTAARLLSAGGPFVCRDSGYLVEEVLRRLGYLDDAHNTDMSEAIDLFASKSMNRLRLQKLRISIAPHCSVHGKRAMLQTALMSAHLDGQWVTGQSSDATARQQLVRRGLISSEDCSIEDAWEGLRCYAREHDVPLSKNYNTLVSRVRQTVDMNPARRS